VGELLILGGSLLVMNSLLVKERMAGKVQLIDVDPPYGIKYASNDLRTAPVVRSSSSFGTPRGVASGSD
jgi:hypothetical protein